MMCAGMAPASDPTFSDPALVPPPPAHAIGFPSRAPDLDVLPGFRSPPPGYGEVAFYWWLGDPLTKERLQWQLDQLDAVKGVMGLQINYAHSDRGGRSYGLTYPSEPALFSGDWWKLFEWFIGAAKRRGMAVSLSDYTLGIGQGWCVDEVLRDDPALVGSVLRAATKDAAGGQELTWELPEGWLAVTAYRMENGEPQAGSGEDLRGRIAGRTLRWTPPAGAWRVVCVSAESVVPSLDPMNPRSGLAYARKFFGQFEDRHPGEGGKGLNFFFSDELEFRVQGNLWTERFAEEFRRRKGYDLLPDLPALFMDIGPRTPKIRLDYSDVKVALTEEGFFKPVFDWHQQRGMIYGCDHGGRGRDVVEFGDYFRTQRWNQGPGCDQPHLSGDVVKNKVASSIAHLYQRPRVWLEGYYGSGWGTTPSQLVDATARNFVMGQNLLTLHGLYYSTHGGWWEWAPPCNHFRMPYWAHMKPFFDWAQRLSYLLSQGVHCCDVAIVYPVAPVEAGMEGERAVRTAFDAGRDLYARGLDFDFIDFESLARAQVRDRALHVSGEAYRVLILPAMSAARLSTVEKAAAFARGGGQVVALRGLPLASDRAGADDVELDALVKSVFGVTAREVDNLGEVRRQPHPGGGCGLVARDVAAVEPALTVAVPRDFECRLAGRPSPLVQHRRIGARDVYAVYGAPKGAECVFRTGGRVELWDPWTGGVRPVPVLERTSGVTRLAMPLSEQELQILVFNPDRAAEVRPAAPAAEAGTIPIVGTWEFELVPTLDNRFGDYRWPPTRGCLGAEARRFRYADETASAAGWEAAGFDDSKWPEVTASFGPKFWLLGPVPAAADASSIEAKLSSMNAVNPAEPVTAGGAELKWRPYEFSWRWGIEGDPGHQGYHGLKEQVGDEFIALGRVKFTGTGSQYEAEQAGARYYLWTSVTAPREGRAGVLRGGQAPAGVWLNGQALPRDARAATVRAGGNPLLVRYDRPGRAFFVLHAGSTEGTIGLDDPSAFTADARWIWGPVEMGVNGEVGFRRVFTLTARPAAARLRVTADDGYTAWINGREIGRGDQWTRVQDHDVASALSPGTNVLAISARNQGGEAGLIAELAIRDAKGGTRRVPTDAGWRCAPAPPSAWRDAGFDDGAWAVARSISPFEGSLWATHPNGPPTLDAPAPAADAPVWNTALASRWHGDADVLPFDTRPGEAQPAGWYRFTAPPGLRAMRLVAHGDLRVWVGGREMEARPSAARPGGTREWSVTIPEPSPDAVAVALRIGQARGEYGGAAILEPVKLDCGTGRLPAGDWSQVGVLRFYSGGAWYRKTVSLTAEQARGCAVLDLGGVAASAEVRVNGRSAGTRVAPPWRFDVASLVAPGENRIEVRVFNTLANHYLTIPTRYGGSPASGLLGPVRLEIAAP